MNEEENDLTLPRTSEESPSEPPAQSAVSGKTSKFGKVGFILSLFPLAGPLLTILLRPG